MFLHDSIGSETRLAAALSFTYVVDGYLGAIRVFMFYPLFAVVISLRAELLLALGLTLHHKVVFFEPFIVFFDNCDAVGVGFAFNSDRSTDRQVLC